MKSVIAFVQPFMAEKVVHALHAINGLSGATFTRVRGFGRNRARAARFSEEGIVGTSDKIRVEAMVHDALLERVVATILATAHTGKNGDGKIYVVPVEHAVRIRTGETGDVAI
jgi:nitrogen regulatory protein P-II 1